ncbi:DUF2298 domain-containing protein [Devosia sp. A16]|uniref:DUF2298 domain-containing protein n=1 Tax=Devosia sp. A16 TaxID=1736675 RepID=UPI0006D771B7|nr:DUF2298 domain-containing protein [Devosia sp. A16]
MIDGASLASLLSVWLAVAVCGVLAWPLSAWLFPTDPDRGYLAAKPLAWIAGSYAAWLAAVFGVGFAQYGWLVGLAGIAALSAAALPAVRRLGFPGFRRVLTLETGFLLLLLIGALIKARVPDIHGLEKFMDFGFVNAALRTEAMPPLDPWWGDEPINYYYFGHVAAAWLIGLARVPADHGFNLMIGLIFAFTGALAYRLVSGTLAAGGTGRRLAAVSGGLAAVLVTLGGNFHSVLYGPFRAFSPTTYTRGYYYPDSTRFVGFDPPTMDHGFTEMPAYGFAVGDLHAHVLNLPVALLIALLLVRILQREWSAGAVGGVRLVEVGALGLLFAVTAMSNSWDAISYGVLMLLVGLLLLFRWGFTAPLRSLRLVGAALLVLALSGAAAAPFLLQFKPISSALVLSDGQTPLWQLAVLYAHLIGPGLVLLLVTPFWRRRDGRWVVAATLAVLAIILIALPEIAYVKDIYGYDHRRANTMFKFTFEAQPMAFLAGALLVGLLFGSRRRWAPVLGTVLAVPLVATLAFAGEIYGDTLRNLDRTTFTLDGLRFIDRDHGDDRPLLDWLKGRPLGSRLLLVEAPGDSYTDTGRFAALSGVPALLGWRGHEWLWRGDNTTPYKRYDEIAAFYQDTDFAKACQFVLAHGVTHIAIGTIEREVFPELAETTLERLGQTVVESGSSRLIAVDRARCEAPGAS